MAHCKKFTKNDCMNVFKHFERVKENNKYVEYNNQVINVSLSNMNYNIGPKREISQKEFIVQRCSEVYCHNRKDVNVMCSWILNAPKDLPRKDLKQFFHASYSFMAERYGEENVISSYVHMDEATPHMHFAFVPITFDKKKDRYKVSASDVINRYELQTFHKELQTYVEKVLGYEVAILNGATIAGNLPVKFLKKMTELSISLKKAEEQNNKLLLEIKKLTEENEKLKNQ